MKKLDVDIIMQQLNYQATRTAPCHTPILQIPVYFTMHTQFHPRIGTGTQQPTFQKFLGISQSDLGPLKLQHSAEMTAEYKFGLVYIEDSCLGDMHAGLCIGVRVEAALDTW